MRVMVIAKATVESEQGILPTPEAFEAMDRYTEELVKAGILVAGAGLKPSSQSKRILFDGTNHTVIDGPFAETRELIAGCECEHGCPTCVGPLGNTGPLAKVVALRILDLLVSRALTPGAVEGLEAAS